MRAISRFSWVEMLSGVCKYDVQVAFYSIFTLL